MELGLRRGTVSVEAHNREWETIAAKTIDELRSILQEVLIDAQHIGSTSIRGICAKPIIDIVIGVSDFDKLLPMNSILDQNGFFFRGQDHPEQYLYVCGKDDVVTHHIHATIYNSGTWNDYVNMRDYLNCHKEDAENYSKLKESLAEQYAEDRGTYTAMKGEMIGEILTKAQNWRKSRDEITAAAPEEEAEVPAPSAAILIPIVRDRDEPALLLEVRSMNVWQPGEVCFPGGHIEAGESSIDTALRETCEELGIRPSSVNILQQMEPERHIEKMLVWPVVGEIDPFDPDGLRLRQEEVSEVFTLPFSWLLSHEPAVYDISDPESGELPVILRQYLKNYTRKSKGATTYYWAYEGYGIWGLTARLLVRFKKMLLADRSFAGKKNEGL
ncbi:MAG: GrpB family protein [Firmicutes bacterium]|nr:GrpB family protein [Bacillota bacterium]